MSDCKITPTDLTVANSNLAYTASLLAGEGHSVQISYNNLYDKKLEGLTARPLSPKSYWSQYRYLEEESKAI